MAKRDLKPGSSATVIPLPVKKAATINVRSLLLDGQSKPTVLVPAELQKAIDQRALELSKEAYTLCREHLQRRVAYCAEFDQPRRLNLDRAYEVIRQGDLGQALARVWRDEMGRIARYAGDAVYASTKFEEKMTAAMQGFAQDD